MRRSSPPGRRPATWAGRDRAPRRRLHPDEEAERWLAAAVVVAVVAAIPLAALIAALGYLGGKLLGVRWWWLLTVPAVGVGWTWTAGGWEVAWADYLAVYEQAGQAGLGEVAAVAGRRWPSWVGSLAPLSLVAGGLVAAGGRLAVELRRPTWRTAEENGRRGRLRREVRRRRSRRRCRRQVLIDGERRLGVDAQTGRVVTLTRGELVRHVCLIGATGGGKTTVAETLAAGTIHRGEPLVVLDLKGDPELADRLAAHGAAAGVPVWRWSFDEGDGYDPLASGDPTELRDRLIGLEAWTEPHYRRAAERYLQLAFRAAQAAGWRLTLAEVQELLDEDHLRRLARQAGGGLGRRVEDYLDTLTRDQQSAVRGLAARIATLAESTIGPRLQPDGQATVDLRRVLTAGGVALFTLDSSRYSGAAGQVGAMVLADLIAAAGARLAGRHSGRGGLIFIDELTPLDSDHLLALVARARGAGIGVVLATQELADLSRVADGYDAQIVGNVGTVIATRTDWPESCDLLASMAGTERSWEETIQVQQRSAGPGMAVVGGATGLGSLRAVDRFTVHPNEFKALAVGEAIVIRKVAGPRIHRVQVILTPKPDTATTDGRRQKATGGPGGQPPARRAPSGGRVDGPAPGVVGITDLEAGPPAEERPEVEGAGEFDELVAVTRKPDSE